MAGLHSKLIMISGLLFGMVAAAFLYHSYRNGEMDRLYAEAAGYEPYYRGSAESETAVKILAKYRGQRSQTMLLDLASRGNTLAPRAQTEAIKALGTRQSPQVAAALAGMLQPQQPLETREAVTAALQNLPCNHECIVSLLHYLERIWGGEPNFEDRWILGSGLEEVHATYKRRQDAIYRDLYARLHREMKEVINTLVDVYGLGSVAPSPFGLEALSRLNFREGCSYLLDSERQLANLSPDHFTAPRQEIQSAIASLKCH